MYDLKACIVCLSTDTKLFSMNRDDLREQFKLVSGLKFSVGNGMPDYLCYECTAYVRNYKKFRDKCHRAYYILEELLKRNNEITEFHLKEINRNHLNISSTLSYMNPDIIHYNETKFEWTKVNRTGIKGESVPTVNYSTLTTDYNFEKVINHETETNKSDETHNSEIKIGINNAEAITQSLDVKNEESSICNLELSDCIFDNGNISDTDNNAQLIENDTNADISFEVEKNDVDGSNLSEEYATLVPISIKEAKAAMEVYKMFNNGQYLCGICNRAYNNEARLRTHARMHDKHISGNFHCELCNYYYKTSFLLKTHMNDKHIYKYLCKKCPEVSFDRTSAKQHYIWAHLRIGEKKHANWYDSRPTWLRTKSGKRVKGVTIKPVKKLNKLPEDFLIYSPITHEEQYRLVVERQNSRNYKEAKFKCNFCYRGFRNIMTYNNHMKKHDPAYAGPLQCDMCKLHFIDQRKMYKHMSTTHLYKYTCRMCNYVGTNKGQAQMHYRWHKNVTYQCPHCDKEFKKVSTRLTHIRIKHPSMNICNLCGHSFVSGTGLYYHKRLAHTKEEIEMSENLTTNPEDQYFCAECNIQLVNEAAFKTHLGSSYKHVTVNKSTNPCSRIKAEERRRVGRPRRYGTLSEVLNNGATTSTNCEVCGKFLSNDVQARRHYEAEHPGTDFLKRYMCDVCGHTTRQYANLMVHMRTHTNEKPYGCLVCERRFSMPSNRDRHMVVHTGEKRYQCQHCNRRFTQSSAVKLHIQTVHLKIPYAPWDKKNRKRRKEIEPAPNFVPAVEECPQPQRKLTFEMQGDYLNAYITYNDE